MKIAALIAAGIIATAAFAAGDGKLPGAKTLKVCAAAGPYWPTMTLALERSSAWVACKEQARVVRVSTKTGKFVRSLRLDAPVIAVAAGYGAVWALDSASTLYRIQPSTARVTRRVALGAAVATASGRVDVHGLVARGGFVWIADNSSGVLYSVRA